MYGPSFGELLASHRCAASLTQEELAERAGLSVHAISMLERGVRSRPRRTTVELLTRALGLSPDERDSFVAVARRGPVGTTPDLHVPVELRTWSSTFVGRAHEVATARSLMARPDVRLLTLTGSPGAGKTRLALEVAGELHDHRVAVAVVSLAPLREAAQLMPAVRDALGLRPAGGESGLETVAAHCRTRQQVLVLDNFEHLLGAGPELVELLARCPGLQALATSRAALRVSAEHELRVPPLPEPASMALFAERARSARPDFQLTAGNAAVVAAICQRLDGLPLALELAAPWVRLLALEQLLARLSNRLEMLVDGPRDRPERQRTLRAALAWSCDLLDPEPLTLLRRLSVFAGGAPLDGLERVCQAAGALPGGVLRHLAVLADHGLVQRQDGDGSEPRVSVLESVRDYGRELLAAAGELDVTAQAHLEHYAAMAARARSELRHRGQQSWLERLRREHGNVRAALGWAAERHQAEVGLSLAGAMWLFWDYGGHRQEGLEWIESLLSMAGAAHPAVRAQALHAAGRLAEGGSGALAIARHEESLAIYRELGDPRGVAEALRGIALAVGNQGDHGRSIALLEEAVSVLRGLEEPALLASLLMNLGVAVSHHGDPGRSVALYEEALALRRSIGDRLGTALCLINLGGRARVDGDLQRAQAGLDEAEVIVRRLGSPYHLAAALASLGDLSRTRGDAAQAAGRYREAMHLFAELGERAGIAVCVRWLGWAAWIDGQPVRAARLYGAAEALCRVAIAPDCAEGGTHERVCAGLEERLGAVRYAAAREAGSRLSLEDAVAEASCPD